MWEEQKQLTQIVSYGKQPRSLKQRSLEREEVAGWGEGVQNLAWLFIE